MFYVIELTQYCENLNHIIPHIIELQGYLDIHFSVRTLGGGNYYFTGNEEALNIWLR